MENTVGQKEEIPQGAKRDTGEEEILRKPLVGRIIKAIRLDESREAAVVFTDETMGALVVELSDEQTKLIDTYLTERQPEECYFWVFTETGPFGLYGIVVAGPFSKGEERSKGLLTEEQKDRWFNKDFIGPFDKTGVVYEVNVEGEPSFRTGKMKQASLKDIWGAFKDGEKRLEEMFRYVRG